MSEFVALKRKLINKLKLLSNDLSWLKMREHDGASELPGGRELWERELFATMQCARLTMEMLGIEEYFNDWQVNELWAMDQPILTALWEEEVKA